MSFPASIPNASHSETECCPAPATAYGVSVLPEPGDVSLHDSPPRAPGNPESGAGDFSEGRTLQENIDSHQRRADAIAGKPGYLVSLDRLKNAKLAALAHGGRNG